MAPILSRLPTPQQLDAVTSDETRLVDLCGVYRRNDADGDPTGEVLLVVGGVWDQTANGGRGGFDDTRTPKRCKTWGINESQLGALDDLAEWFEKRRKGDSDRVIIESLGGPRGGGKTDFVVKAAAAFNIEFPGSGAWIFNPTIDKREEVETMFKRWVPVGWAQNQLRWPTSIPDCRFRMINGSSTRSLSAEVPAGAKRGDGAEFIALNEAQQMRRRVYSLALPGIRKNGGLLMAAHNPPEASFPAGEWVVDLVEKGEAGKRYINHRWIDPRLNPSISSSTMAMIDEAMTDIDPIAAAADIRGEYRRLGDFVYSKFRGQAKIVNLEVDAGHGAEVGQAWTTEDGNGVVTRVDTGRIRIELPSMVRPTPQTGDVTAEVLRKAGWYGGKQSIAIGADFQTYPHQCAAAVRAFRDGQGRICYWVSDEIIVWGSSVSEAELSQAIYNGDGALEQEYDPASALIVPDCSGGWQKANRQLGASSKGEMEGLGWKCKPPTEIKQPDKSSNPANPPVHRSIALMGDVMREGRFFVDPVCKWTIQAGPKVPYKKDGDRIKIDQRGGYAHIWDCIRYVIWLLEPKKKKPAKSPQRGEIQGINMPRTGPRMI